MSEKYARRKSIETKLKGGNFKYQTCKVIDHAITRKYTRLYSKYILRSGIKEEKHLTKKENPLGS